TTAREWTQDYEAHVHTPIALKAGIKPEILEAIRDGRRPVGMSEDQEIIYDFCVELHRNKRVADATYERALKKFGESGVVDITGISGYYVLLAMEMNMSRYPLPAGGKKLPRFPEESSGGRRPAGEKVGTKLPSAFRRGSDWLTDELRPDVRNRAHHREAPARIVLGIS